MDANGYTIDHAPVMEEEFRRRLNDLLMQPERTEQEDEDHAAQETITVRAEMHQLQAKLQRMTRQPVRPVRPMLAGRGR